MTRSPWRIPASRSACAVAAVWASAPPKLTAPSSLRIQMPSRSRRAASESTSGIVRQGAVPSATLKTIRLRSERYAWGRSGRVGRAGRQAAAQHLQYIVEDVIRHMAARGPVGPAHADEVADPGVDVGDHLRVISGVHLAIELGPAHPAGIAAGQVLVVLAEEPRVDELRLP